MLATLKALADPSRLRLLAALAHGEFTVQELTAILQMGQSRISRHLKILLEAGLLAVQRQGTWGYYRLGEENPLFRELWPWLERRLESIPGRQADLERLALALEGRRRRSREFFDRHARVWDELAGRLLPVPDYREALLAAVPAGATVLEVGVGTGPLLLPLARKAARVIGVDHSPAMLEEARRRLADGEAGRVDLRLGEMTHLPLSDGEAGCALLNMVLHHAPRPAAVLAELARVLAPGGILLVADLARHEQEWVRERLADQWLGFDRQELAGWLRGAGLTLEHYRTLCGGAEQLAVFLLTARKG